jgi:hypothetical protein
MLASYSQYSPQGLVSQFPGLLFGGLGAGVPQTTPGSVPFGYDSRYAGVAQYPFAPQPTPWSPTLYAGPSGLIAGQPTVLPITSLIGQLAQQICVQGAIAQQTGIALYQLAQQQLAQQLMHQSLHAHANSGLEAGHAFTGGQPFVTQPFAAQPFLTQPYLTQPFISPPFGGMPGVPMGTPYLGGPFGQPFASPFASVAPGGFGGLSPQVGGAWATARPTIQ